MIPKATTTLIAGTTLSALLLLLSATFPMVHFPTGSAFGLTEALFAVSFTSLAVTAGLLIHFLNQSQIARTQLSVQLAITTALAESASVDEALERILESVCCLADWKVGAYWSVSKDQSDTEVLRCLKTWSSPSFKGTALLAGTAGLTFRTDERAFSSEVFKTGKPFWISELSKEALFKRQSEALQDGLRSALALPITCDHQVCAVIEFFSSENRPVDRDLMELLAAFGSQIGQFIHRERAIQLAKVNQTRFLQLAENVHDVFWIGGPGGEQCIYVSPAYEQLLERNVSELYENSRKWLDYVHEEDRQSVGEWFTSTTPSKMEFRIRRPDGSVRWIWSRNFPVRNEAAAKQDNSIQTGTGDLQNAEPNFCLVMHDITDRKVADQRVKEFYSTVSHELRTPLTSIKASLGLVTHGIAGDIPEEASQLLSIAASECDRLVRLINDILDLRKIEAGKFELNVRPSDITQITEQAISSIKSVVSEEGVNIATSIDCRGKIKCDNDRILQVLSNLLSNAIKFSSEGKSIELGVNQPDSATVRFFVRDAGTGIEQGQLGKLFGKFQQLDSSDARSRSGTGLGLAISKAIVEQHGGTIGVDTKYGEGSTFWFDLPGALEVETEELLRPSQQQRQNHPVL